MPSKRKVKNVYGDGAIHQRPNGRYQAIVELGRDSSGRRQRKSFTASTIQECRAWATETRRKHKGGIDLTGAEQTVREFVREWLPAHIAKRGLKATTLTTYQHNLRIPLEVIGDVRLCDLQPVHLDKMVSAAPSPIAAKRIYTTFKSAMQSAIQRGFLESTLFIRHEAPKSPPRKEARHLQKHEIQKLLAATTGWLKVMLQLALSTGLRLGEMTALTWDDIDFEKATLRVDRTARFSGGQWHVGAPKTQHSRRTVRLSATLVEVLRKHRQQQAETLLRSGVRPTPNLVFPSPRGKYVHGRDVGRDLRKALLAAGLPSDLASWHSLRHTFVALALSEGVDIYEISRRIGHSTAAFTLQRYAHLMDTGQESAASAADEFLTG